MLLVLVLSATFYVLHIDGNKFVLLFWANELSGILGNISLSFIDYIGLCVFSSYDRFYYLYFHKLNIGCLVFHRLFQLELQFVHFFINYQDSVRIFLFFCLPVKLYNYYWFILYCIIVLGKIIEDNLYKYVLFYDLILLN